MNIFCRKLDNTAKAISLDDKNIPNVFRFSVNLKEPVDPEILKSAIISTLDMYPNYRVKMKNGFFWHYLENNSKNVVLEKENRLFYKRCNFKNSNQYLFKISYSYNRINLDMFHVLTDGKGTMIFLKAILCNYLNIKYNLKDSKKIINNSHCFQDAYLTNANRKSVYKNKNKKSYTIKNKYNLSNNKTYYYILDLEKFKKICKKYNVTITEYLSAIYIYAIYKSIYDKSSNKDISLTLPIDLRKYYNVDSFSNFFTCVKINSNILEWQNISFETVLNQIKKEFKKKITRENIEKYLARDVKLGTNLALNLVPLVIKKIFMKYAGRLTNQTTSTLSNVGPIKLEEQYKKYIDNITVSVSTGRVHRVKCTVCSFENNLTVTVNSNLISTSFENQFSKLLKKYVGKFRVERL